MSNQEKNQPHEPAKRAPKVVVEAKPRRRRGFFSLLVSHLMVATIAVIGVGTYMHWNDILTYTGSRVCAYDVLGKYGGQTAKVPPIDLKKPEVNQTNKQTNKQSETQKQPAEEKPQANNSPATIEKPGEPDFNKAWDEARKLFWKDAGTALAAYEKLLADHPDNADLRAETGNVYYKSGDTKKAVQKYLQAGKQYKQQKNPAKADEMMKILEKLAPEKAKELAAGK